MRHSITPMQTPTLREMVRTALYIGSVGYGGPAILALMKKHVVHQKRWVSEGEFFNALSFSQILPGATGVSLMGYLGYRMKGLLGGILVPFAFVFPAMVAITLLAWGYFAFGDLHFVHAVFTGLGAMVVALLINATLIMGGSIFPKADRRSFKGLLITALAFAAIAFLHWNVFYIIFLSGLSGVLFFSFDGADFGTGKKGADLSISGKAPQEKGSRNVLTLSALAAGLALLFWLSAGSWKVFATFFKIGSVTFGGGFAAIPLIQDVVVDRLHWLDITAFRDGIALGQITPGPVFITATFIGYKVNGLLGAVVATLGVFTPSLAAMMLLSRAHAKVKNLRIVQAFVKGLLAGMIGLLLSVTRQFGVQSLVDWQTWAVFALSAVYLILWRKDALWLILGTIGVSLFLF